MYDKKRSDNYFLSLWQEIRITFFLVASLLIIGIFIGLMVPQYYKIQLLQTVLEKFSAILSGADEWYILAYRIFINNLNVTAILFVGGIFIFIPGLIILINSVIIGIFLELSYNLQTIIPGNFWITLASLVPHGIFEIPAFILSATFGINLGLKILAGKNILSSLSRRQSIIYYSKQFLILILPLLIIAAFMEATVSSYLLDSQTEKYQNKYLDSRLAFNFSDIFLKKYQCETADNFSQPNADNLIESPILLGGLLYDMNFLQKISRINNAAHWTDFYQCQSGYLKITSSSPNKYRAADAVLDRKYFLDKLDYSWEEKDKNLLLYRRKNGNLQEYVYFVDYQDKLIVATWSGMDYKILKEIL